MVGIPGHLTSGHELHRFLTGLLSNDISVDEKKKILNEYDLGTDVNIVKKVEDMCNLSYDIKEKGIIQGRAEGIVEGRAEGKAEKEKEMIISMHKNGLSDDMIAKISEANIEYVKDVLYGVPAMA